MFNEYTNQINIKDISNKKIALISTNIINGNNVVFTNSDLCSREDDLYVNEIKLSNAMRSSMSFPGIFKPFKEKNMILTDGGIVNNCPVRLCQSLGANIIITSNISIINKNFNKYDNLLSSLHQITDILIKEAYRNDIEYIDVPNIIINLDQLRELQIPTISFDKIKLKEAINMAYTEAKKQIQKNLNFIKSNI